MTSTAASNPTSSVKGKTVVVIGATGLVGGGAAQALSRAGHQVLAIGRRQDALQRLSQSGGIRTLMADLSTDDAAVAAAVQAQHILKPIDVVIASINPARQGHQLLSGRSEDLLTYLNGGLLGHLRAAKAFLPRIAPGGGYIAIGGASSEFVWPGHGHISLNQAAQRMLFQVIAQEASGLPVTIREYMIAAMVTEQERPDGVSADAVGADLVRVIDSPSYGDQAVLRFPPATPKVTAAQLEANKQLVRRHFEDFVNRKNAAVIRQNMTPDFLDHDGPGGQPTGVAGDQEMMERMYALLPDLTVHIEDILAEGDKVLCRNQWRGTNAKTGQRVEFHGFVLWRIKDGKIAERWATVTSPAQIIQGDRP